MTDRGLPEVEVLDVFEIDERGRLVPLEPNRRSALVARPSRPAPPARDGARAPRPQAAGSPRSFAPPPVSSPTRLAHGDVRCAALVDPVDAAERLVNDRILHDLDGLEASSEPPRVDGPTISWSVTIRRRRWNRRRSAELCVHPSPSWVMTMIELRPVGGRRFSRGFVRAGLPIVVELSDRLVVTRRPAMSPA